MYLTHSSASAKCFAASIVGFLLIWGALIWVLDGWSESVPDCPV